MVGVIDLVVLAVIVISVLFALYRGLVRELLGISSWLLAGFVALYSYDPLLKACEGQFENVKLAAIVGTVLLALTTLIVMTILNAAITHKLRKSSLSGLDRIFGFAFGVARAVLLIALAYIFASSIILSPKYIDQLKQKNHSIVYIQTAANWVENLFPDTFKRDLADYRQNKKERPHQKLAKEAAKKAAEAAVDYKESDRDSLDNLVAGLKEMGDLE